MNPTPIREGGCSGPGVPVKDVLAKVEKSLQETPRDSNVDKEQIFMLFASFSGDVVRTAHSAGVTTAQVIDLATEGDWMARIREVIELKKSDKAGIVEKEFSRATNFVQACRYRIFLERIIRRLIAMSEQDLFKFLVADRYDKSGKVTGQVFSTRPLADLASALEKIHWMTYQALGDTPQDRLKAKEPIDTDDVARVDIHARIAKAMAGLPEVSPRHHIEKAHAEEVQFILSQSKAAELKEVPPASPSAPIQVDACPPDKETTTQAT